MRERRYAPLGVTTDHEARISSLEGASASTAWGDITGTLSNQSDLQSALDAKAASSHTHVEADITDLGAYLENVVEDLTPQLGGNLDLNSYTINGTGSISITGAITATSFGGITSANLLDKTATETVSGLWTFSNTVSFTGTKVTMNQLFINESSAADADVAGDGQFWVLNSAPNAPFFTDDAGNDYALGYGEYRMFANQSDTVDAGYINGAWYSDNATAYTLTLQASTLTTFPVGAQFTIWNEGSGTLTINEGTGTTLYLLDGSAVTDTAGGCTMAQGGYATVIRKSTTVYLIMGAGLTA